MGKFTNPTITRPSVGRLHDIVKLQYAHLNESSSWIRKKTQGIWKVQVSLRPAPPSPAPRTPLPTYTRAAATFEVHIVVTSSRRENLHQTLFNISSRRRQKVYIYIYFLYIKENKKNKTKQKQKQNKTKTNEKQQQQQQQKTKKHTKVWNKEEEIGMMVASEVGKAIFWPSPTAFSAQRLI